MTNFTESKIKLCIRLARECSRNSWQCDPSTAHKREYLSIKKECMTGAREYKHSALTQ